jgi:TolA-binding protein
MSKHFHKGMSPSSLDQLAQRLDQLLGKVEAMAETLDDQSEKIGRLAERTAMLEQIGTEAKQVIEAWTAARTSLRFMHWGAGMIAAVLGAVMTVKHWLHR